MIRPGSPADIGESVMGNLIVFAACAMVLVAHVVHLPI
jgi:hypothetical protein